METQFRNLDMAIMSQPMPSEFQDTKATILCNDCSGRSTVPYHWLGLKCGICRSYNTVELQILGPDNREVQAPTVERTIDVAEVLAPQAAETSPTVDSREGATALGRRRHSSQGVEIQRRASDLIIGSYPPLNTRMGPGMAPIESEAGSEDGILGFWGRNDDDDDDDFSHSDDESDDSLSDAEDDDEDDDEEDNDIMLIGHR
jgi:hypothetical protein